MSLKLTKKSSDLEYVEELQPKNIGEKEISKMFGISYTMLKTQRNGEAFDTDICLSTLVSNFFTIVLVNLFQPLPFPLPKLTAIY